MQRNMALLFLLNFLSIFLGAVGQSMTPISISVLTFNDDGVLFLADPIASTIYAYPDNSRQSGFPQSTQFTGMFNYNALYPRRMQATSSNETAYNLRNIDSVLAALLGTVRDNIFVRDMASHPSTKEAYLGVEKVQGGYYVPAVVIVNSQGQARLFDLNSFRTPYRFQDRPTQSYQFWGKTPIQTLTFTDMEFYKGKLYVAGLSNGDFKSTLRILNYPFTGYADGASVEIYHANHDQNETRAPIRTMKIVQIQGTDYVLAAYTCTPLVLFPLNQLQNGAHITGKTVAELGYGNTPIDMISYTAEDFQQQKFPVVMLSNRDQNSMVMKISDVEAAMVKPGLNSFAAFQNVGVPTQMVPLAGMLQIANLDDKHILALRREAVEGSLSLLTYQKNLYFRLSDFISEYEFPSYRRDMSLPTAGMIKGIQEGMKKDEGYQ